MVTRKLLMVLLFVGMIGSVSDSFAGFSLKKKDEKYDVKTEDVSTEEGRASVEEEVEACKRAIADLKSTMEKEFAIARKAFMVLHKELDSLEQECKKNPDKCELLTQKIKSRSGRVGNRLYTKESNAAKKLSSERKRLETLNELLGNTSN